MVSTIPWNAVGDLVDALGIDRQKDLVLKITIGPEHVDVVGIATDWVTGERMAIVDEAGDRILATHFHRIPITEPA